MKRRIQRIRVISRRYTEETGAGAQTSFIPLLTLRVIAKCGHSVDGLRDDDPGNSAAGPSHRAKSGTLLGSGRLHVDRQPNAGHHQPTAGLQRVQGCRIIWHIMPKIHGVELYCVIHFGRDRSAYPESTSAGWTHFQHRRGERSGALLRHACAASGFWKKRVSLIAT